MKQFLLAIVLILAGFCIVPGSGAKMPHKQNLCLLNAKLQDGDIIVRSGKGFISEVFRNTSKRDRRFSHAGLVMIHHGKPFVCHIIGHETDKNGADVRLEPIESFCSSEFNQEYAIYRCGLNSNQQSVLKKILALTMKSKLKFDDHFDLNTNEAMYCSEFISKMLYRSAGICFPVSHIGNSAYIGVDDLYLNSFTTKIAEHKYRL